MPTGTLSILASIGGITLNKVITETGDHANVYGDGNTEIPLAAGKAVTAWVKSDADTAACNLPANHGYSSGKMDVFWTGGSRYDVDGVVNTNALALDSGTGDDFPDTANATVVVCAPQQINTEIDGDEIQLLVINSTQRASVYFAAEDVLIKRYELAADQPVLYSQSSGAASPLTGDPVTVCWASNGTTTAGVLTILSLEDSTP